MLTFTLHDSLSQILILPVDLNLPQISSDVIALRRGLFMWAFQIKEMMVSPGHNHLN